MQCNFTGQEQLRSYVKAHCKGLKGIGFDMLKAPSLHFLGKSDTVPEA